MTDGYPFWLLAAIGAIAFLLGRWSVVAAKRGDQQKQSQPASRAEMLRQPGAGVDVGEFGLDAVLRAEFVDLLRQDRKIEVIRLVRQQTGRGLKEAKDFVEDVADRLDRKT